MNDWELIEKEKGDPPSWGELFMTAMLLAPGSLTIVALILLGVFA